MQIQASQETDRILPALLRVQMQLPVIETPRKMEGGRVSYKYANMADIWRQAKPILQEHGVLVQHPTRVDDEGRCYLQTVLYHVESAQWVGAEIPLDVSQEDSRRVGGRMSFLRRYTFCSLLAIATADDDEARWEAEMQRNERRAEAAARKEALTEGRVHRGPSTTRPVSEPPPRSEEPPQRAPEPGPPPPPPPPTPPTPPSQRAPEPPPQGPPLEPEQAIPAHGPTVDQLVQMVVAEKKRSGHHPAWVVEGVARPLNLALDAAIIKKSNLHVLCTQHQTAAIELGRMLYESAQRAGEVG